ncbi:MAG: hypothetical protein K0R22_2518, partial [Sporomusa sp.]|nr:hypothetical protein [Sporomusa sp.]
MGEVITITPTTGLVGTVHIPG